jgi:hypothetical protein
MSNARIVERITALADEVELGQISVAGFRDELLGHTETLEGVPTPTASRPSRCGAS